MWTTRPLLNLWGHIPHTPWEGAAPPPPPLPALVGFGFARVLGPTRGVVANVDNSPLYKVLWGHIPQTPCHGGFAPLDPLWLPLVGLRFAGVLGPTRRLTGEPRQISPFPRREGGQGVRSEKAHLPQPLAMGASPPWTPLSHPRRLRVRQGLGSHSGRGCQCGRLAPSFKFVVVHPPYPLGGGVAPATPFARPRGLRVRQRFGSHS